MKNPINLSRDDVLSALGLQNRRSLASVLGTAPGLFSLGLATGSILGLLLAPRSGRELRQRMVRSVNDVVSARRRRHDGSQTQPRDGEERSSIDIQPSAGKAEERNPARTPEQWSRS